MRHGSLFSGIGGFDLAARWMGWNNIFQVEIDKFCIGVLNKNFPNTIKYNDIKQTDFTIHRGQVDILTGGFPCQPFSIAGQRKGKDDNRYLWPQMLRAIQEIKPTYIVAENVYGLLNISEGMVFRQVCADLENEGYEVQPLIIPACAVNAPHKRERIWIVAHANGDRAVVQGRNRNRDATNSVSERNRRWLENNGQILESRCAETKTERPDWTHDWIEVATEFCRVDDGISDRVDRLKSLGNAIVPQVAYQIFKAIECAHGGD